MDSKRTDINSIVYSDGRPPYYRIYTPVMYQLRDYDGTPLYGEFCEPLAALDGPWNEHDFV